MITVVYVCVNYNGSQLTLDFVDSVKRQVRANARCVIVDNASAASDRKILEDKLGSDPDVKLIFSTENLGYFGGLNLGIASIENPEFVVVGNNDLKFSEDFTKLVLERDYPQDVLVLAPNVTTADGYQQNPHSRTKVARGRKFLYDIYFKSYYAARVLTWLSGIKNKISGGRNNSFDQAPGYVHMGIGACYVLLPSFFKKFKQLDNKVFLYGEEAILAGQLENGGGKMYYDPDLLVHHMESATLSKLPSRKTYGFARESYPVYKKYL
ncbi:Glycosyltransferase, GT2 family [Pseudomonas sp. NFR02]|uniref:glycosyltransferase family 2 protein n=1 Tax=Pseudomonas sp. NFR02 TaxID=1566229 RepID=UPI0009185604|nr:glycosyltransferase [Pseudomonas sp. NFR02]SFX67881.1 Glycosyltransferase, GT2 family [Pseudomonas sp. NFR02]